MDGRWAAPSQYVPQYLLFFAAEQLQPGCAHFLAWFSAMTSSSPLFPNTMNFSQRPSSGPARRSRIALHPLLGLMLLGYWASCKNRVEKSAPFRYSAWRAP